MTRCQRPVLKVGPLLVLVSGLPLVWLGASAGQSGDQVPGIAVRPGVQISTDEPASRFVESWLAINPRDPRNLIAASMVLGERSGVAAYASKDGGTSWGRATGGALSDRVFEGLDPAVAFDGEGTAYLLTLSEDVAVWKSTNGGRRWGERVIVHGSGDRPFIGCDRSRQTPLHGRIYVSGKHPIAVFGVRAADWHSQLDMITVATSRDGAASFGFPGFFLPAPEKDLLNVVSDLLVAPDGRLFLALQTFGSHQDLRAPLLSASYSTIVSEDGGQSFSEPRPVAEFRTFGHAREGKSLFGLGGGRLAMDTSQRQTRGRLYFVWLDVVDGYYHVMAAFSADGGRSWSRPVRVNDDREPIDHSNPAVAVNEEGVVGISWNDRRGDPTDRCYQLFFAASADGGASFSQNVKVDERFTCPIGRPVRPNAGGILEVDPSVDPVSSEYRFKNGGDTQGIVGQPDGGFHLAWINGGLGEMQLWSTVVLVDRNRLETVPSRPR